MSVLLCTWGDVVEGGTEEALTVLRRLARATDTTSAWLVLGPAGGQAGDLAARQGIDRLIVVNDPKLAGFQPDALVEALRQVCEKTVPATVLFNQTVGARLVAPRLAARLGAAVVMNAFAVGPAGGGLEVTATAYGGDTHVVYRLAGPRHVVSLVTTTIVAEAAAQSSSPQREDVALDLSAVQERFRVVSSPKSEGPRLEDAEIIVSGGRGLGSAANFELVKQLADGVGGMWGGSRAIVDDGWIDSSRQVGLTGKITRPGLYVAAGISGASQHMAGCSAAKTIVAINKDPDASIFRYARYGIVADCLEVLPELIKAVRA
ncbi:MAG: electron transfer flavoprotein subunit alpha/FixB family protein [Steroidobacteraceae bacterium]